MRSLPFGIDDSSAPRLTGALHLRPGSFGQVPSRLSAEAEAQIVDGTLLLIGGITSGVRLELLTDSSALELDLHLTRLKMGDQDIVRAVCDLVVDGGEPQAVEVTDTAVLHVISARPFQIDLQPAPPATVRFDLPGEGLRRVEVWLPHNALCEVVDVRVDDQAAVEAAPRPARRWVHYGSSISHCLEAARPTETWPAIVGRRHDVELINLAIAGQAHLDQFAARAIRSLAPDAISIKVGINVVNGDTLRERTFAPAAHGFLDTIRDVLPDTPILVVTPIICPVAEDHPGPTLSEGGPVYVVDRPEALAEGALSLTKIRSLLATVVGARVAAGDEHLSIRNGLDLFGPDDVDDLPDGLHPNGDGYKRMADRFEQWTFAGDGLFT